MQNTLCNPCEKDFVIYHKKKHLTFSSSHQRSSHQIHHACMNDGNNPPYLHEQMPINACYFGGGGGITQAVCCYKNNFFK